MNHSKLSAWSATVKARDGRCLRCGVTDDLHAHHTIPKSVRPDLTLDISNGETLCYRCHKAEHERNRPIRMRSNRPQRRTLEAKIAELSAKNDEMASLIWKLEKENGSMGAELKMCKKRLMDSWPAS